MNQLTYDIMSRFVLLCAITLLQLAFSNKKGNCVAIFFFGCFVCIYLFMPLVAK